MARPLNFLVQQNHRIEQSGARIHSRQTIRRPKLNLPESAIVFLARVCKCVAAPAAGLENLATQGE
jgi:hypothetical protein